MMTHSCAHYAGPRCPLGPAILTTSFARIAGKGCPTRPATGHTWPRSTTSARSATSSRSRERPWKSTRWRFTSHRLTAAGSTSPATFAHSNPGRPPGSGDTNTNNICGIKPIYSRHRLISPPRASHYVVLFNEMSGEKMGLLSGGILCSVI